MKHLKKQKYEYEVFEPVESTLEYKMGFKAGVESVKQKEQKPAEWSKEDEKYLNLARSLQQKQPETDMKSPFTGGKVAILSRQEEVTFRGEKVKILRKYYRCEDTGREFTDSKLDDDMMWAVFRAYCEKTGMTSFNDIILKQEQPEVDLEEEIKKYCRNYYNCNYPDQIQNGRCSPVMPHIVEAARHFAEWGAIHLNARKEK